jgi:outer membrane protein assembly factor BamB
MSSQGRDDMESFDRALPGLDDPLGPSPQFVAQLRLTLRQEARRLERAGTARATAGGVPTHRIAPAARALPLPPSSRAADGLVSRALVVCLIAVLLLVSVTVLNDPAAPRDPAVIPGGFAGSPTPVDLAILGDIPTSSDDPARTNARSGSGLSTIPTVARRAEVAGTTMVQAGNLLVIVADRDVTTVDARTLTPLWSVELPLDSYGPPTVAGDQIYLTVGGNTEAASGKAEENQLLALSLRDGHELWRIDGAGAYPTVPIVAGETVYSLGVAERRTQLGAYRVTDGEAIWQSDVGSYTWCCPRIGIAMADGLLAVSDSEHVSVFEAVSGTQRWSVAATSDLFVGSPTIVGDRVIVNQEGRPSADAPAPSDLGSITAFDLQTGSLVWSNDDTLTAYAPLSASAHRLLYAGTGDTDATGQLTFVGIASGETVWSIPFPRIAPDVESYIPPNGAPIIAGETAYVAFTTVPWGGGSVVGSMIAAIDLSTGIVRWMARIDGSIMSTAIAPNGYLFVLTLDAGLIALEESGQTASSAGEVVDLRQPATCEAVQAESPLLGSLPATPSIPGVAPWKQPVLFSQIPSGQLSNVGPAAADEIAQRFKDYRSCSLIDPYRRVFGFFSTDFYVRLLALDELVYDSKEQPWAVWMAPMQEYLVLDKGSLLSLPDGRIGGIVNSPMTNIYVWWVQEDGVWKIDEYHRVEADPVDPSVPTPAPSFNAEGTPLG